MEAVEWTKIVFPSLPKDLFRAKLSCSSNGKLIWLECKKSKEQWGITISDIADHSPKGILLPDDTVLSFLQKAFDVAELTGTADTTKKSVSVDLKMEQDGVILKLSIDMDAILKADFHFKLLPIELKPTEILAAQLREVQEDVLCIKENLCNDSDDEISDSISQLKEQIRNVHLFTKVDSQSARANSPVFWKNAEGPGTSLIKPCGSLNQITIDVDGWYQITACCSPPSGPNGYFNTFSASGAAAIQFDSNISLILSLHKGCTLSITTHAYSSTTYCQMTLLKLTDSSTPDDVKVTPSKKKKNKPSK